MPKYGYIDQLIEDMDAHTDKVGSMQMKLSLEALKMIYHVEVANKSAEESHGSQSAQAQSLPH